MRWIALFLLLLNLGAFAWFVTTSSTAGSAAQVVSPSRAAETQKIVLVSEMSPEQLPPVEEVPSSVTVDASGGQLCTLIGPFPEEHLGQDIAQRLSALQISADLRGIEMPGQMRYWVFLPPLNSRREAFSRLRELQARGIDSYVIPKGTLADGISFGIFSERDRAESLTAELVGKGVGAQFREEPQTHMERWIILTPGQAERLGGEFWQQLQEEHPKLDRRRNLCSEVAS
ncbi:SPOR domain-containing protein [Microbulbifer epialgicus]|uniref:SPOR domain-containing protein n=1 Tax=Microbulbifer epialgicus TaxID=393907 RepID=A0ABV4NXN4_9GAMM